MAETTSDRFATERKLILEAIEPIAQTSMGRQWWAVDETEVKAIYKNLYQVKGDELVRRACATLQLLADQEAAIEAKLAASGEQHPWLSKGKDPEFDRLNAVNTALNAVARLLLKRKLPPDETLLDIAMARFDPGPLGYRFAEDVSDLLIRYCAENPLPDRWQSSAESLHQNATKWGNTGKAQIRFQALGEALGIKVDNPLEPTDAVGVRTLNDLAALAPDARDTWNNLIRHFATVTTKPSKKWLSDAVAQMDRLDADATAELLGGWLRTIGEPGPESRSVAWTERQDNTTLDSTNEPIVCGMIWAASRIDALAPAIAHAAAASYKKLFQGYVRSESIGAAAIRALGTMTDRRAVEELAKLEMIIRTPKARNVLTKVLDAAAEREGVTRDDLAETAAPEFGLSDGVVSQTFGDATAQICLDGEKARVSWIGADGKPKRSIPKQTKADHPEAPAEIKALAKDLETAVVAQRRRIERLMRAQRSWPADRWLALYHNHPLVGLIARRLIWDIDGTACIWHNDAMRSADGEAIDPTGEVRLWHPIGREIDEVTRWRETIENRQITQPFKQAHREVYILTDAERTTGVYSNRFAAHVLKTAALSALCQTRGWICGLYGGESSPRLDLPTFSLRAEYWVDAAGEEYTDFGTPKYLATDQVRFYEIGGTEPLPLDRVHPLALSEAMRDVDMFVGITSVGNDPQWNDGGPDGRYRDYWHSYSFGDLSGTAQTRKAVLERLVPKLKIAERCSFTDKFLVVRGDVRTYKIHLGSGNILMEPNDQYLCIVAGRAMEKGADKVFLPFEGDRTLAIVISKALMLADDTKIKDATILSQIGKSR